MSKPSNDKKVAMTRGDIFLVDEIPLADDCMLERLESVLNLSAPQSSPRNAGERW
jgi:hypothetical protein